MALIATCAAVPIEPHNESPAEYEFSYAVNEPHTGDIKSHQESRKGHAVTGKYELIDSDGYRRIVEYTADEHTGFIATVHREPTDIKIPIFESHPTYHSHVPEHYHLQSSHLEHSIPVHQPYVAFKEAKNIVEPIVKVTQIEHIETAEPEHNDLQFHHSHEPSYYQSQNAHLEQSVLVQQPYVAPKVAKKLVKPIEKEVQIEVTELEHHPLQFHHSHETTQHQSQNVHSRHSIPVQQPYVAPKVAKDKVKTIVKVTPIEVTEPEHHDLEVKYVAPTVRVAEVEHSHLNTHVSYNAPEFSYHY